MSRRVRTETDTAERERTRGESAQKLRNGHDPLGRSLLIRDKETI